ncbi:hypothetical protein K1T35_08830 [Pseudonocardia sp. DSM 110487]|uniref:hypothetical protein n=1 Tax=Pseudonocardia sp. DSM 110487 TaxID=2865833 RepID=UPI001C69A83C|nr:hypothetical protein [Pseudonocardia sp. DSM 110487]QYN37329.1 hypothetical protein K1T35_08830 [Pseudonocardia sp. DSM 110487]
MTRPGFPAHERDACRTVPIAVPAHGAMRTAPPASALNRARWGDVALADLQTQPMMIVPPATRAPANAEKKSGAGEGLALSISSALGALAGLASWLIAARLLPQAESVSPPRSCPPSS